MYLNVILLLKCVSFGPANRLVFHLTIQELAPKSIMKLKKLTKVRKEHCSYLALVTVLTLCPPIFTAVYISASKFSVCTVEFQSQWGPR